MRKYILNKNNSLLVSAQLHVKEKLYAVRDIAFLFLNENVQCIVKSYRNTEQFYEEKEKQTF